MELPDHINQEKCRDGYHNHWVAGDTEKSLSQAIRDRIEEAGAKTKSNSVLAIEYVVALSGGAKEKAEMWHNYSETGFLGDAMYWVAERHGGMQNVVSVSQHFDESNPHAHIVVVPLVEKSVKWKNQKGQGSAPKQGFAPSISRAGPTSCRNCRTITTSLLSHTGLKWGSHFTEEPSGKPS